MGRHGWHDVSDEESIAAVQRAVELGVNLFDTADVYGFGHSESVLASALGDRRHDMVIATKGGVVWDSAGRTRRDISPKSLRGAVEASVRRLSLETIPLYQIHWPDGRTPLADAVGELERCRSDGLIRWIGVCNVDVPQLQVVRDASHTVATQFAFNVLDRAAEASLLPFCSQGDVAALVYSPLAQGLLAGNYDPRQPLSADDVRRRSPYFQPAVLEKNVAVATACSVAARELGLAPSQLALRWILAQRGVTAVLSGLRTAGQVDENVAALAVRDDAEVLRVIDDVLATVDMSRSPT